MPKIAVAAVAVLLLGGAAPAPKNGLSDPVRAALIKVGSEVAALAYFIGTCEHHYTSESNAALVARFTGASSDYDDKFQATIGRAWAQSYGEGRRDAAKNDWSEEYCDQVTKEAIADIETYTAALRAASRPKP